MVRDLAASADFYAKLVGATKQPTGADPDTWAMAMPGNRRSGLTLRRSGDRTGVIDHFGIGVADFDAEKIAAAVQQVLPKSQLQFFPGAVPAVAVRDPDGIQVQLGSS
jgi:catechol 2,3-dioxygenase-like lactoylglutathione lyase family enzyme